MLSTSIKVMQRCVLLLHKYHNKTPWIENCEALQPLNLYS